MTLQHRSCSSQHSPGIDWFSSWWAAKVLGSAYKISEEQICNLQTEVKNYQKNTSKLQMQAFPKFSSLERIMLDIFLPYYERIPHII